MIRQFPPSKSELRPPASQLLVLLRHFVACRSLSGDFREQLATSLTLLSPALPPMIHTLPLQLGQTVAGMSNQRGRRQGGKGGREGSGDGQRSPVLPQETISIVMSRTWRRRWDSGSESTSGHISLRSLSRYPASSASGGPH